MSNPTNRLTARKSLTLASLVILVVACAAGAQRARAAPADADPAHTDGDKYQVVLENARVRVLHYRDQPGDETHPHHHPCFVLYALAAFERKLSFPDGTQKVRKFASGDVAWMPAQSHVGKNIGVTPSDALLVELKGPCSD
jgi:beta-alanine degradation protein BauB